MIELFIAPRRKNLSILTKFHVYPHLSICTDLIAVAYYLLDRKAFGFLDIDFFIVTYARNTMMLNEDSF